MNEQVGETGMEQPPREDLVQTAVKFLQNPNVVGTPLENKQKFLQRKGLTDKEIQLACERAGAYENQSMVPPPLPQYPIPYPQQQHIAPLSLFDRIKDLLHNFALFSAAAYIVYKFYTRFIKPFLFGDKKKKTIEETVEDLSKTVNTCVVDLKDELKSVKAEVDKMNQITESNTQRQLQHLQSDISTVKGLLLSRKQFPLASTNSSVAPPSIPAWQLSNVSSQEGQNEQDKQEKIDSPNGSPPSTPSELEQEAGNRNSDSSLEIM